EDVRFGYGDTAVLHGIDLTVPGGATVGLVGATGSGKSTLLKLLLRFETPDAGRICFDGVPVQDLPRESLRRQIGFVAQDAFLTDGSLADNIAYGDTRPDPARIEAAARAAEAHVFIAAAPDGYDSPVG